MAAVTSELVCLKSLLASLGMFQNNPCTYSVIAKQRCISHKILSFMAIANTLKLIAILLVNDITVESSSSVTFLPGHSL